MTQIIQLQGKNGEKAQAWLTLGEVVAVHIDKAMIKDGVYQTASRVRSCALAAEAIISRSSRKTCSR